MPRVDRGDMQKELEGACANAEPLNPELREALVAHLAAPQQHARSELCPDLCIHQGLAPRASPCICSFSWSGCFRSQAMAAN